MKVFRINGRDWLYIQYDAQTLSLNESLPHKRKRQWAKGWWGGASTASMKVFRINGRDEEAGYVPADWVAASMKVFRINGRDLKRGCWFWHTCRCASMKVFRINGRDVFRSTPARSTMGKPQ